MSSIQGVNSDTSSLALSVTLSLPSGLTPAQLGQAEQILEQAASGTISTAQAQAELAALTDSQSQATSQGGTQVSGTHHHHGHHHEASSDASGSASETLASVLNLSTQQQSEITSILQAAQKNGSSPSDVQAQINGVLTPAQQQQLANLNDQPPVFTTTA
jgi:hypothetical protein